MNNFWTIRIENTLGHLLGYVKVSKVSPTIYLPLHHAQPQAKLDLTRKPELMPALAPNPQGTIPLKIRWDIQLDCYIGQVADTRLIFAAVGFTPAKEFIMRKVIIESPYAGDIKLHLKYLAACMQDCLYKGEAPMASHCMYTMEGVLNDNILAQRNLGILAGFHWRTSADATVVYTDLGISKGMQNGIADSIDKGVPVEYRLVPNWTKE